MSANFKPACAVELRISLYLTSPQKKKKYNTIRITSRRRHDLLIKHAKLTSPLPPAESDSFKNRLSKEMV